MTKKLIAGGCSFTLGNELSDDVDGRTPSKKSWAYELAEQTNRDYVCTAFGGLGNPAIARRVFNAVANTKDVDSVAVMWSFPSRYDWAMPRHTSLEDKRWTSISPWDADVNQEDTMSVVSGSESQTEWWSARNNLLESTGVKPFANAIYRYAANEYHEIYLSWKSIIWLQNILEKREIPYMFTLADNSLFYNELNQHKDQDELMLAMHSEIDFTKWHTFGDRMMGFNQWSLMEEYPRGVTHPLDEAHSDAVQLMLPTFKRLI